MPPSVKAHAAAYVGIPTDAWKTALYAVLMGARIPSVGQAHGSRGAVAEAIRSATTPGGFEEAYGRFLDYTAGLRAALKAWHRWLDGEFVRTHGVRNNAFGKTFVTNGVGAKVAVEDLSDARHKRKAQLAAFLLQGREAAFTHALAASAATSGFRVLSHEHDGLAVQGEIPAAAIRHAALKARLPIHLVELVEKPFL